MSSTVARRTAAWTSAALACALFAGCMHMSESECRSADWYQLGYRDGDTYGLRPQVDQYAYLCQAYNTPTSEPTYMAGWVDGHREFERRMMGSECCGSGH